MAAVDSPHPQHWPCKRLAGIPAFAHPKPLRWRARGSTNSGSVKAKGRAQMHCFFFICCLVNVPPFQPLPRAREMG